MHYQVRVCSAPDWIQQSQAIASAQHNLEAILTEIQKSQSLSHRVWVNSVAFPYACESIIQNYQLLVSTHPKNISVG